jgi:hypothetical protein
MYFGSRRLASIEGVRARAMARAKERERIL